MFTSLSLSLLACLGACSPGEEPGTVVVVGGDLRPITFSLPTGIDYQLSYDAARLALWFDPAQTQPAPPLTTFQTPAQITHGDLTGDARINGVDIQIFVDVLLGVNIDPILIAQADFDDSGAADLSDVPLFVSALLAAGPFQVTVIILYVEGLTASTDLCDTPVELLTDPQGTGAFTLADTAQITAVGLIISPQTGGLGTPVTITLTPAIAPLVFDAATIASWTGVYDPVSGPPSTSFTISFDASQVRESNVASAVLVAGDGSVTNPPDFATLDFPGAFDGALTLNLGLPLSRTFSFTPTGPPAVWESITYQDSSLSTGPPVLNGEPANLIIMFLSNDPNPIPDEVVLLQSYLFHLAAVMRIAENPTTIADAPGFIEVDLVTFDSGGVEIDRRQDVRLDRVMGDDGEPANLVPKQAN